VNINEFKNFVSYIARKQVSGSNPTPTQFNLAVERAFYSWVLDNYGNKNEYIPGQPIPSIQWQSTQVITDNIRFLLQKRFLPVSADGEMKIPDGTFNDLNGLLCDKYLHVSSVRSYYIKNVNGTNIRNEVPVSILRDFEFGDRLFSTIDKPTLRYPVCFFYADILKFEPENIGRVQFTYLRIPKIPKWAYTIVNGRDVYNAALSIDIESPDITHTEIAARTLRFLGYSIRESELVQYAEQMKNEK